MKTLIIFLCSLATYPECYHNPETIPIQYEGGNLCSKIEQDVATALVANIKIHPFETESWLIAYDCGDGKILIPLHDDNGMNE